MRIRKNNELIPFETKNVGMVKATDGNARIPVNGGYLLFDEETEAITGYEGNITKVDIPEISDDKNIATIESYAFCDCSSLKSISIPDSVTSIGHYAFGYQYDTARDTYVKTPGFKIYGCSNDSAAAKYAKDNGLEYAIAGSGEKQ